MAESLTGASKIYGIIGDPVTHSFSPIMQNAAFALLKMDACYVAFPVKPQHIPEAVAGLRSLNIAGVNITVPHKSSVIPYLDEITPLAQKIGAVNTIRNDRGRLIGTNTDVSGFLRSLKVLNFFPENKTIALLGAGGSARALLAGFADAGASRIIIHNRTAARATNLVAEFTPLFVRTEFESVTLETVQKTPLDLLVNTTTVGMKSEESPVDLNHCQKVDRLADIIYNPSQTRLLRQADALGIPAVNGLGMLLYQGCEAFTFWTGKPAPEAVMREQLLNLAE